MAHLSRWMSAQGLAGGDLSAEAVERFAVARRASHRGLRSPRAPVGLLEHLRSLGAISPEPVVATTDPVEVLLERFAGYLSPERGLAAATVSSYVSQVRPFAGELCGRWDALTVRQVAVFVTERSLVQPPRSVAVRVSAASVETLVKQASAHWRTRTSRGLALGMTALVSLANIISLALLVPFCCVTAPRTARSWSSLAR